MITDAATAAHVIAAHGLSRSTTFPTAPLDPATWQQLLVLVERDRLIGLLAAAVRDDFPVSEAQHDDLADRDERWQGHALVAERHLVAILELFERRGIERRVIKGPALAHTVYHEPEHRVFGDLDILVPAHRLADARSELTAELGADDLLPELRPGFDAEFAKDVVLRVADLEVDLHRTIAPGPFGLRVPTPALFDDPATFNVGARAVPTLGPTATIVQVCCNAALGDVPSRLISLRDVAQAIGDTDADPADVVALVRAWRLEAPVRHAVTMAWDTFSVPTHPLANRLRTLEVGRMDRMLLAASTSASRSYTRQLASVTAIPGIRAKARYTRAILAPQPAYLEARGWARRDHVTRAWRRLRTR